MPFREPHRQRLQLLSLQPVAVARPSELRHALREAEARSRGAQGRGPHEVLGPLHLPALRLALLRVAELRLGLVLLLGEGLDLQRVRRDPGARRVLALLSLGEAHGPAFPPGLVSLVAEHSGTALRRSNGPRLPQGASSPGPEPALHCLPGRPLLRVGAASCAPGLLLELEGVVDQGLGGLRGAGPRRVPQGRFLLSAPRRSCRGSHRPVLGGASLHLPDLQRRQGADPASTAPGHMDQGCSRPEQLISGPTHRAAGPVGGVDHSPLVALLERSHRPREERVARGGHPRVPDHRAGLVRPAAWVARPLREQELADALHMPDRGGALPCGELDPARRPEPQLHAARAGRGVAELRAHHVELPQLVALLRQACPHDLQVQADGRVHEYSSRLSASAYSKNLLTLHPLRVQGQRHEKPPHRLIAAGCGDLAAQPEPGSAVGSQGAPELHAPVARSQGTSRLLGPPEGPVAQGRLGDGPLLAREPQEPLLGVVQELPPLGRRLQALPAGGFELRVDLAQDLPGDPVGHLVVVGPDVEADRSEVVERLEPGQQPDQVPGQGVIGAPLVDPHADVVVVRHVEDQFPPARSRRALSPGR